MDKRRIADLLTRDQFSEEDLNYLARVVKEKPYFQVARAILAKAARSVNHPRAKAYTNFAAVYSTDRSLLRSFFDNQLIEKEKKSEPVTSPVTSKTPSTLIKEKHLSKEELEQLYQEIDDSIREIEINKAKFLSLEEKAPKPRKKRAPKKKEQTSDSKKKEDKKIVKKTEKEEPPSTSKKDEEEYLQIVEPEVTENIAILDELKQKSELEVKNRVTRNQMKIIDEFLNNPIELKPDLDDKISEPIKDLSSTSVTEREDVISENLADIMLKQGKKDKAVDILKKLIWKYPKKKAYFAARIEEIKKD